MKKIVIFYLAFYSIFIFNNNAEAWAVNKTGIAKTIVGASIIGAGLYFGNENIAADYFLRYGSMAVGSGMILDGITSQVSKDEYYKTQVALTVANVCAGLFGTSAMMYSAGSQVFKQIEIDTHTSSKIIVGGGALVFGAAGLLAFNAYYISVCKALAQKKNNE